MIRRVGFVIIGLKDDFVIGLGVGVVVEGVSVRWGVGFLGNIVVGMGR